MQSGADFWPARRGSNSQSSESESDALSNYATGGDFFNLIKGEDFFLNTAR